MLVTFAIETKVKWKSEVKVTISTNSLQPHELYSPWNSPGQNTRVGSLSLLQEIFLIQKSNPGLPYCRQFFTSWAQGKPKNTWVGTYPFSSGSSWNQTKVSCILGRFITTWAMREALRPNCFLLKSGICK